MDEAVRAADVIGPGKVSHIHSKTRFPFRDMATVIEISRSGESTRGHAATPNENYRKLHPTHNFLGVRIARVPRSAVALIALVSTLFFSFMPSAGCLLWGPAPPIPCWAARLIGAVRLRVHAVFFDGLGGLGVPLSSAAAWCAESNCLIDEKGSVESTHKVPTSHYHTKRRTDGRCHH